MNDCDYLFTISIIFLNALSGHKNSNFSFIQLEGTPVSELSKMKLKVLWGIGTMS